MAINTYGVPQQKYSESIAIGSGAGLAQIHKAGIEDEMGHLERSLQACYEQGEELGNKLGPFLLPASPTTATNQAKEHAAERSVHATALREFTRRVDDIRMRLADLCQRLEA